MPRRVIVDENAGPGTEVWKQFRQVFGGGQSDCVFLAETHRGIPDVEILDKLLRPNDVLLTGDCVLHMQAKLQQLARTRSNEVTSLDFDRVATCLLAAEQQPASIRIA